MTYQLLKTGDSHAAPVSIISEESDRSQSDASFYRTAGKRLLDLTLTLLSLPLIAPLIAVMAALIALDGHNPFYTQLRVGRGGKTFRIWKLRTMVYNADDLLESYLAENPAAREEWESCQKLKNDPRVTWIGSILRKTSMDELAQLLNVLNGTMSLVGPRPFMVQQRDVYKGSSYTLMRPGITGMWQVSDRNDCEFVGRVRYDDIYNREMSLRTDVMILLRTVGVVLRATGY